MTPENPARPTSSPPRPAAGDDLKERPRPSSPSPTGDEVALESNNDLTNTTTSSSSQGRGQGPDWNIFDTRACRKCGCTENNACHPPCWWTEYDLCSACSGAPK